MTRKRFTILYGVDENPFEWDIMDNEKDALICQCNGKPICDLLNELAEENEQLKEENQELHKLNQEYINSLSDEKKETLSEMLNAILGDDEK